MSAEYCHGEALGQAWLQVYQLHLLVQYSWSWSHHGFISKVRKTMLGELMSLPRSAYRGKVRAQDIWLQGSGFQALFLGPVFHARGKSGPPFSFFLTLTWLPKVEAIFSLQCAGTDALVSTLSPLAFVAPFAQGLLLLRQLPAVRSTGTNNCFHS